MATSSPLTTAPPTPEPRPKNVGRSFTAPTNLISLSTSNSPLQAGIGTAQGVETLFVHPSCTVIKFSTASALNGRGENNVRGLEWTSPTERTLSTGSLEIYRVPGSVSFLRSGELLHAILPRSQCWCVDGVSRFALRVMTDTYYRIELPGVTTENLAAVDEFKTVLGKVMHYEKTSCPFARDTDEEELPELEDSRNKTFSRSDKAKQWKLDRTYSWKGDTGNNVQLRPVGAPRTMRTRSDIIISNSAGMTSRSRSLAVPNLPDLEDPFETPVAQQTVPEDELVSPNDVSVSDDQQEEPVLSIESSTDSTLQTSFSDIKAKRSDEVEESVIPQADNGTGVELTQEMPEHELLVNATSLEEEIVSGDEVQLNEALNSSDGYGIELAAEQLAGNGTVETVQPLTNFHTLQQIPTDMPPSPPDSSAGFPIPDNHNDLHVDDKTGFQVGIAQQLPTHEEAETDTSVRGDDPELQSLPDHLADLPSATKSLPAASNISASELSQESGNEDPFAAIQARILARRSIGGTTSFYPPVTRESTSCSTASVSSSLSARSRISNQRNLASALVQKACTVFLGPPAYLVAMMLRIAARLASGKLGGMLNLDGNGMVGDTVPGSFHVRNSSCASEEEDDFGVALNSPIRVAAAKNLRERKIRERYDLD